MAPSQLSILSFAVMPLTVLVLVAWARRDVVGLDWVPAALEPGCRVHACLNLTRRSPSWCLRWPQRKQRSSLPSCSAACFGILVRVLVPQSVHVGPHRSRSSRSIPSMSPNEAYTRTVPPAGVGRQSGSQMPSRQQRRSAATRGRQCKQSWRLSALAVLLLD